jgi:hypothetical protein
MERKRVQIVVSIVVAIFVDNDRDNNNDNDGRSVDPSSRYALRATPWHAITVDEGE